MENNTFKLLVSLLDADRQWTARELTEEVGVYHKTVYILGYRKLAAHWVPHEISKVQQWHHHAVTQALLDRHQREGDDFLG